MGRASSLGGSLVACAPTVIGADSWVERTHPMRQVRHETMNHGLSEVRMPEAYLMDVIFQSRPSPVQERRCFFSRFWDAKGGVVSAQRFIEPDALMRRYDQSPAYWAGM